MFENNSDRELLTYWCDGSQAAFTVLFERYFNKLLQFTIKKTGNREQAEELVMDILLRLWQRRDTLDTSDSLSPYLFQSVKNGVIDLFRKNALKTLSLEENTIAHPHSLSTEESYDIKELKQIYLNGLEKLSPQRKRVFELSRIEGKSHKEISLELNVSVSTVKQHINASLSTLRDAMQPHTDVALTATTIALLCMINKGV